jgi:hypothetical protein
MEKVYIRTFKHILYVKYQTSNATILIWLTHYFICILWQMAVFIWKASCYTFNLLWNFKNDINTAQALHKCWMDHSFCSGLLNLKFHVTMATRGHIKSLFYVDFSIKTAAISLWIEIESKAFQRLLRNGRHDAIFSLSQV